MNPTADFAREAARLAAEPLPDPVAEHAALSLFNVLATAVGAARHPGVDAIVTLGERHGAAPVAAPPGRSERLDAHHTAMATAFAAHVDDFDDTHLATVIHPGAACLGVLAALAGEERDGAHALRAFAAGCEAQLRLGLSVTPWHYDRGWHITGTCGPVGAAVTAMSLLGVSEDRWQHGIGHALHATLGMREGFGTMCKALHPARAAANGIRAARLAAGGVDGPRGSLPDGAWVDALAGRLELEELLGDPDRWRLLDNTFKPYPCGIVSHPAIEAAEALVPRIGGAAIERVELRCHPLVPELTGNPQPADGLQARFSTIHGVAAGLLDGSVALAQYDDARVRADDLVALRGRTTLVADEQCPRDAAELRVTAGGEELTAVVEHARGSLARQLGWEDLRAKAEPLAEGVLGAGGAQRLEAAVRELAAAPGFAAVLAAAEPSGAAEPHPAEAPPHAEGPVTLALAAFAAGAEPPEELLSADAAPSAVALAAAGDPVAAAVGLEVSARLEAALAPVMGPWLPEATAGLIGAAAAAARASGADTPTTATALAIAATQCTGFADEPEQRCRELATAHAAEVAVEAARLAVLGFTGPAAALEGRRGVFALLTGTAGPPAELLEGLGERWVAPAAVG